MIVKKFFKRLNSLSKYILITNKKQKKSISKKWNKKYKNNAVLRKNKKLA